MPLRRLTEFLPAGAYLAAVAATTWSLGLAAYAAVAHEAPGLALALCVPPALLLLSGMLAARRLAAGIAELERAAQALARRDFDLRLPLAALGPLSGSASDLQDAAAGLEAELRSQERGRTELRAVLRSMTEGVLALDPEERVIGLNRAAAELFGARPETVHNRPLAELVRHPALTRLVGRARASGAAAEAEITLRQAGERTLLARVTPLRDSEEHELGLLVVLHDVTRLRRLEQIRRDFVANVSHELRTPVTSIQGFAETLLDGALEEPERAGRYLAIIARQAARLNAIIEDLLTLARAEQSGGEAGASFAEESLAEILRAALELVEPAAARRRVQLALAVEPDLRARVNSHLLEGAVANLLDNAVKYSPEGGTVHLAGRRGPGTIVIEVADEGAGIATPHLERIFERFYRVDKARSREAGGTGLGLAIVKHVAQAHGGTVSVASQLGAGSTFRIHLPASSSVSNDRLIRD